jgi:hypothetical protein
MQMGVNSGNGKVQISYSTTTAAPAVVQTAGFASGAFFPVGTTTNTFALVGSNGDTLSKCSSTVTINSNTVWYLDADNDGYYTGSGEISCTSPGANYKYTGLTAGGDCDDTRASVHPGAVEVCANGIDDNCNGQVDEKCNRTYDYQHHNYQCYPQLGS